MFKTSQQITRIHECVLERVWENVPTRVLASADIRPGYNMTAQRNKVCGVDIHKKFLIATILTRDGTKLQKRFETDIDNLLNFRDWVIEENCDCVAIESTGVYWYPVHAVLENKVELILANAHQIKHTPGRKRML